MDGMMHFCQKMLALLNEATLLTKMYADEVREEPLPRLEG